MAEHDPSPQLRCEEGKKKRRNMTIPNDLPKVEVVIYDGKGGPGKDSIPVRNDFAQHGADIGYAKNDDHLWMADVSKISEAMKKECFNSGWAVVWKSQDGAKLVPAYSLNCVEQTGHLKVVESQPAPPAPEDELLVLKLVKVEHIDGQVFYFKKLEG